MPGADAERIVTDSRWLNPSLQTSGLLQTPLCPGLFYEDTAADDVAKEILADYLSGAARPWLWTWIWLVYVHMIWYDMILIYHIYIWHYIYYTYYIVYRHVYHDPTTYIMAPSYTHMTSIIRWIFPNLSGRVCGSMWQNCFHGFITPAETSLGMFLQQVWLSNFNGWVPFVNHNT
jgi:hypothetical protein